jgi:hypothetical protein
MLEGVGRCARTKLFPNPCPIALSLAQRPSVAAISLARGLWAVSSLLCRTGRQGRKYLPTVNIFSEAMATDANLLLEFLVVKSGQVKYAGSVGSCRITAAGGGHVV